MAFTQADLDGLRASIAAAGNTAEVRYADGTLVRYLTTPDALALLSRMESEVAAASASAAEAAGTPVRARAFRASYQSGW